MKFLTRLTLFGLGIALLLAGAIYLWLDRPLQLSSPSVEFRLPPGTGLRAASRIIRQAGVELPPDLLVLAVRLQGLENAIRAGTYGVEQGITPRALLKMLAQGKVLQVEVRLLEGNTFRQWRSQVEANPGLEHLTTGLSEAEIMNRLGATGVSPEGQFFPDTYVVDKYSTDLELLARARKALLHHLEGEWAVRASGLPYRNAYEALTMASIVEKETGRAEDRGMVAGVFINRLGLGMRLQTDPTVIYGLGTAFDGNLRRSDLLADTPYNTYTRTGLPPTPIAMPSLAALQAALNPEQTQALYFVARGDGSSHFSRSLAEHNQAVNRYQRGGR